MQPRPSQSFEPKSFWKNSWESPEYIFLLLRSKLAFLQRLFPSLEFSTFSSLLSYLTKFLSDFLYSRSRDEILRKELFWEFVAGVSVVLSFGLLPVAEFKEPDFSEKLSKSSSYFLADSSPPSLLSSDTEFVKESSFFSIGLKIYFCDNFSLRLPLLVPGFIKKLDFRTRPTGFAAYL